MDEWKGDLWNVAGIPTPPNDHETNETLVFGYMVAWFLGEVRQTPETGANRSSRVVALTLPLSPTSTSGRLVLPFPCAASARLTSPPSSPLTPRFLAVTCALAALTFTTTCSTLTLTTRRASVVSTTGERQGFLTLADSSYCIERSASHCADVFTTVSHITAYESEHLLKRKPGE